MRHHVTSLGDQTFLSLLEDYNRYKNFFEEYIDFPTEIKGKRWRTSIFCYLTSYVDYQLQSNLSFVRIFFDTPTFDRITKDDAAKFVNILAAVGGTMGLLTGFSIISLVEILYFALKIVVNMTRGK